MAPTGRKCQREKQFHRQTGKQTLWSRKAEPEELWSRLLQNKDRKPGAEEIPKSSSPAHRGPARHAGAGALRCVGLRPGGLCTGQG